MTLPAGAARRILLCSAASAFVAISSARAQAWLAPRGEASFGAVYQNIYTRDHLFFDGEPFDGGRIRMQVAVFGLSYSFTDRLAASASVPYASARYDGKAPHTVFLPGICSNAYSGASRAKLCWSGSAPV